MALLFALFLSPGLALIPIILSVKRKRIALVWIILAYVIFCIVSALTVIFPLMVEMTDTGHGDPVLLAGAISENLVTSLLLGLIALPFSLLMFMLYKKYIRKP